jgi:hypothetical protein
MKALVIVLLALALEGGFLLTLAAQPAGGAAPAEASRARPAAVASGQPPLAGHVASAR